MLRAILVVGGIMMSMQMDRVLRYIVLGGIFLLPVIPFIVANNMFFPVYHWEKFFLSYCCRNYLWSVAYSRTP